METHERRFRDHNPENIPSLVRKAVKLVPVEEFFKLRHQKTRFFDATEYKQMSDGADVIQKFATEQGKTYRIGEAVPFSVDPWVIFARQIVTNMSTPKYLDARRRVLSAVISDIIRRRNEYELLGAADVEKEKGKFAKQLADLNLTNKVIVAVKIR